MDSPGLARKGFYQAAMEVTGNLELSAVEIEFFRRMTLGGFKVSSLGVVTITGLVAPLPTVVTQDLLFTDGTYDIGKSGATRPRDGFFSRNAVVGGTLGVTGITTLTAKPVLSSLSASQAVFSDSGKGLVSNAITGTGNVVMSASPTLSGTPIVSSLTDSVAVFSNGSKGLVSNAITGTGNVVMSASPTMTGTIGAAAMTLSTPLPVASGGTGLAAITTNSVMLGAGTSDVTLLAPGTSGNLMTSNGTVWGSTAPAASAVHGLNVAEGRLTLTSGTPVTTADVTGATSVYYTPYVGNTISLYDGSSAWTNVVFTQITISLSGFTASKPYDIFIYDNSGTATAETLIWTNTTTRATALAYQDGVLVKSGATTRRYVGTVYINASGGQTDDSEVKRYLQNYYHRVRKSLRRIETTESWTYTLLTKRQANGSTANQVDVMVGVSESVLELNLYVQGINATAGVRRSVEIAEDATNAFNLETSNPLGFVLPYTGGGEQGAGLFIVRRTPAVGRHFYAWVENSDASGTTYFYGNAGNDGRHGGMVGSWEC